MKVNKYILFLSLLAILDYREASALSHASCKVTVAKNGEPPIVVISTPNLPPYISFNTSTCSFSSNDNRLVLNTGVLTGGFFTSIYYDGAKILSSQITLTPNVQTVFTNDIVLPSGDFVSIDCKATVNRSDATALPRCGETASCQYEVTCRPIPQDGIVSSTEYYSSLEGSFSEAELVDAAKKRCMGNNLDFESVKKLSCQ